MYSFVRRINRDVWLPVIMKRGKTGLRPFCLVSRTSKLPFVFSMRGQLDSASISTRGLPKGLHLRCVRFLSQEKDATEAPRYYKGKLITSEEEDLTVYPKFLLSFTSTDEDVVEDFFNFVQKATKMIEIDMTKAFAMPATKEAHRVKLENAKGFPSVIQYDFKRYRRFIEISNLTYDKADIFLDFVRPRLPAGVDMKIELQRWEMVVDPNHPSLRPEQT